MKKDMKEILSQDVTFINLKIGMNYESFENSSEHVQRFKEDVGNGCNVDFGSIKPADKKKVQTLMSGVVVTAKPKPSYEEEEDDEEHVTSEEEEVPTRKRKTASTFKAKKKVKDDDYGFGSTSQTSFEPKSSFDFGSSVQTSIELQPTPVFHPTTIYQPTINSFPLPVQPQIQSIPLPQTTFLQQKHEDLDFDRQSEENPRVGNYTVEYAKSGRSTCVISGQKIPNKALRIGREEDNGYDGHTITRWMNFDHFVNSQSHQSQFQQDMSKGKRIDGLLNLNSQDQTRVNNLMSSKSIVQPPKPVSQPIIHPNFEKKVKQSEPVFQTPEKKTFSTPKKQIERDEFKTPKRTSPSTQNYNSGSYYATPTQSFSMPVFEKISDEEASKHLLTDLSKTELQLIIDRMIIKEPKYKDTFEGHIKAILSERIN